ncbi:MAG: hypothetical protein RLZZ507_1898 [Cyanobacteriota bacterium]|jgi:hypothetical protein
MLAEGRAFLIAFPGRTWERGEGGEYIFVSFFIILIVGFHDQILSA